MKKKKRPHIAYTPPSGPPPSANPHLYKSKPFTGRWYEAEELPPAKRLPPDFFERLP